MHQVWRTTVLPRLVGLRLPSGSANGSGWIESVQQQPESQVFPTNPHIKVRWQDRLKGRTPANSMKRTRGPERPSFVEPFKPPGNVEGGMEICLPALPPGKRALVTTKGALFSLSMASLCPEGSVLAPPSCSSQPQLSHLPLVPHGESRPCSPRRGREGCTKNTAGAAASAFPSQGGGMQDPDLAPGHDLQTIFASPGCFGLWLSPAHLSWIKGKE